MSGPDGWLGALGTAVAGQFLLERELAPDGDAWLVLARDLRLERPVIMNVLRPELGPDPVARARFLARATLASRLGHPGIVPIHAVNELGELCWYVSGFVPGRSLQARCRQEGPVPPTIAAQMARDLVWAIAYAHEHGVVHGGIGPGQIFLEEESGRAVIVGMGTVRGADPAPAEDLHALVRSIAFALQGTVPPDDEDVRRRLAELPAWAVAPLLEALRLDASAPPGAAQTVATSFAPPAKLEIPKVLQTWLDARNPLRVILITWSLSMTLLWVMNSGGTIDTYLLDTWAPWLLVWPVAILQLRPVLRAEFRREDVLGVLDQQLRLRREEMGDKPVRRSNAVVTWTLLLLLLGAGATQISYDRIAHDVMQQFVVALAVLLFGAVLVQQWRTRARPARQRDEWMEQRVGFWRGPLGRLTFFLAGFGLRGRSHGPSAFDQRPTTVILADSVRELARRLPRPLLAQFPDARATADRLERAATALRDRITRLEALPAARVDGTVVAALAATRARHHEAVLALETLRLALLAAQGGAAQIGSATQELEDALEVAARIGELAQGHDEAAEVIPG